MDERTYERTGGQTVGVTEGQTNIQSSLMKTDTDRTKEKCPSLSAVRLDQLMLFWSPKPVRFRQASVRSSSTVKLFMEMSGNCFTHLNSVKKVVCFPWHARKKIEVSRSWFLSHGDDPSFLWRIRTSQLKQVIFFLIGVHDKNSEWPRGQCA